MINRRSFLKASAASSVFGYSFFKALKAFSTPVEDGLNKIKYLSMEGADENFWNIVRNEFLIRSGTYLNNGTYGPTPRIVVDKIIEHMRCFETIFEDIGVNIGEVKKNIAEFIRCKPEEVAITRNTTDGMSMVANGLDLKEGDEILSTDQEHPGGICCWRLKAKRHNLKLKQIKIPMPPSSKEELVNLIADNITKKTKVISISHITFSTGLIFPVRKIADIAHDKGIVLIVDGAHTPGMLNFNISELNCDYFASSSHKWLCAPQGTGVLYLRNEMQDRLWTTIASSGWNNNKARAGRFDNFGTRNLSVIAGLGKAVEFQQVIGQEVIENRIRELITYFKKKLLEIPGLTLKTSMDPELSSGVASFEIEGKKSGDIWNILSKNKIRVRNVPEFNSIRVSTHIYNKYEDIDLCLNIMHDIARGKLK